MPDETQKPIEKPWAVYRNLNFQYRIGKIRGDSGSFYWIKFRENEDSELWDKRYVRAFDDPLKAIAYLLVITEGIHTSHKKLFHKTEREDIIQSLFIQFPNERKNIESLLAQSQPKCTMTYQIERPFLLKQHL